jgi:hypothetical protein
MSSQADFHFECCKAVFAQGQLIFKMKEIILLYNYILLSAPVIFSNAPR